MPELITPAANHFKASTTLSPIRTWKHYYIISLVGVFNLSSKIMDLSYGTVTFIAHIFNIGIKSYLGNLDSHISLIQKFLESDISIHLALRGGLRVT
jgi:hypothetical protein